MNYDSWKLTSPYENEDYDERDEDAEQEERDREDEAIDLEFERKRDEHMASEMKDSG